MPLIPRNTELEYSTGPHLRRKHRQPPLTMSSIRTYESPYPTPFLPHMGVFDFILPASPGISPLPDWDPSVPAYIHGIDGTVLRRGELRGKALQLATGLKERGLRRGDVACIWGTNSLEWIVAAFGCMAAGLVLSPANAA